MIVQAIALVAIIGCAAGYSNGRDFPSWAELDSYTFKHYVADARRPYAPNSAQWAEREAIFNARIEDIKKHNKDPSMTWKRGINQFSDWTDAEFASYNTADPNLRMPNVHTRQPGSTDVLPRFVDYRLNTNPQIISGVKNQGSCGSCWAHSATETLESHFALQFGQLPVLSVQQIISCTSSMQGCGGGWYDAAWQYVQEAGGLNEEFVYPYVNFFAPVMSQNVTAACVNVTKEFPIIHEGGQNFTFTWWPKANVSTWTNVKPNDAPAMMEAVATVGPLSISVAASKQWSDYESGIVVNNYTTIKTNTSWQSINHAVQLVGYGFDFDLHMNYWVVRNSWGTNYGEQGYIRLDRPAVEPCGNLTGTVICGTSGLLTYPAYVVPSKLIKSKRNI